MTRVRPAGPAELIAGLRRPVRAPLCRVVAEPVALTGFAWTRHTVGRVAAQDPLDILVVDDEPELREQLRRLFARDGHRVVPVTDGRSAVDRASTARFDIILLDVALGTSPDGYEVCQMLRGRHNVTPIIMLTALDSEADAVLGLEAGADDYVTKPF